MLRALLALAVLALLAPSLTLAALDLDVPRAVPAAGVVAGTFERWCTSTWYAWETPAPCGPTGVTLLVDPPGAGNCNTVAPDAVVVVSAPRVAAVSAGTDRVYVSRLQDDLGMPLEVTHPDATFVGPLCIVDGGTFCSPEGVTGHVRCWSFWHVVGTGVLTW